MTHGSPIGHRRQQRAYRPLVSDPSLFLEFAKLSAQEDEIIWFANRYGLLAGETAFKTEERNLGIYGDLLTTWKNEISRMHETVNMWELVRANSPELARFIKWHKDRVTYRLPFRGGVLAAADYRAHWLKRWKYGETRGPALMVIQTEINEHLSKDVAARILWNASGTALDPYFVPRTLLGAIWLQFARALVVPKKYRSCEVCGKVMEISTDPHSPLAKRADALICGDRCRS